VASSHWNRTEAAAIFLASSVRSPPFRRQYTPSYWTIRSSFWPAIPAATNGAAALALRARSAARAAATHWGTAVASGSSTWVWY
jgi:hypothetical protein